MKMYDKFKDVVYTYMGYNFELTPEHVSQIEYAMQMFRESMPPELNVEISDHAFDRIYINYIDKTYEVHEAAQYVDYLIRKSRWQSALLLFACFLGLTSSIVALLTVNGVL